VQSQLWRAALVSALVVSSIGHASGAVDVVPAFAANQEGDVFTSAPFDIAAIPAASMRYQQVYNASEFASWVGPRQVTQIAFRPSGSVGVGQAFTATLANVRIDLSTTNKAANGLNTQFAANVGADDTVVFNGPLHLSSSWLGPVGGPKDFDIIVNLTTPFTYDASAGNLLLDVRNFGSEFTTYFNGTVSPVDGLSRIFATDVSAAGAQFVDNAALVTRFTHVPEPTSLLILTAAAAVVCIPWRRGRIKLAEKP